MDLKDKFVITGVGTQGRFGNGDGVEYVEEYWLEYSRDNGTNWNKWTGSDGNHVCTHHLFLILDFQYFEQFCWLHGNGIQSKML